MEEEEGEGAPSLISTHTTNNIFSTSCCHISSFDDDNIIHQHQQQEQQQHILVNQHHHHNLKQEELFYLIYKLFEGNQAAFKGTRKIFHEELTNHGLLGYVHTWDGHKKIATPEEFEKKFWNVSSHSLLHQLDRLLVTSPSPSLLTNTQVSMSPELFQKLRKMRSRMGEILYEMSSSRSQMAHLAFKLKVFRDRERSTSGYPLHNNSHDTDGGENIIKGLGSAKYIQSLENKLDELEKKKKSNQSEIEKFSNYLIHTGYRSRSLLPGVMDDGLAMIQYSQLPLARYGPYTNSRLGLGSPSSASSLSHLLKLKYNYLWIASGHFYNPAYCCVMDRTGRYAITGADDYLVKIWDMEHGVLVKTLRGHQAFITVVSLSNDNALIASACTAGTLRIWKMATGECLGVMQQRSTINCLQFDSYMSAIISAAEDGSCIVWDLTKILTKSEDMVALREASYPLLSICSKHCRSSPIISTSHDHEDIGFILTFPHIKDGLTGEGVKIISMDINSVDGLLVTGSDDCLARVWRFYSPSQSFNENSITNANSIIEPKDASMLNNIKSAIDPANFAKLECIARHLVCRLEGHNAAVTDSKFSHSGDRIVTASEKDGTARIWFPTKDFSKVESIIININQSISPQNQLDSKISRNRNSRIQSKTSLLNIAWSSDDRSIILLHTTFATETERSQQQRKEGSAATVLCVYDSFNGKLLNSFPVSKCRAHVLVTHPTIPTIVLTTGEDGFINIWDVEKGCTIFNHLIISPPDDPENSGKVAQLVDASFTPDGVRLAVTDHLGRLIAIGPENPERFNNVRKEQYYSTDYHEIVYSADGWAVDASTQLQMNFAPSGPLCYADGTAYDPQPILLPLPSPFDVSVIEAEFVAKLESLHSLGKQMNRNFVHCKKLLNECSTSEGSTYQERPKTWGSHIRTLQDLPKTAASTRTLSPPEQYPPMAMDLAESDYSDSDNDSDDENWNQVNHSKRQQRKHHFTRSRTTTTTTTHGSRSTHLRSNTATRRQQQASSQSSNRLSTRSKRAIARMEKRALRDLETYDDYSCESSDSGSSSEENDDFVNQWETDSLVGTPEAANVKKVKSRTKRNLSLDHISETSMIPDDFNTSSEVIENANSKVAAAVTASKKEKKVYPKINRTLTDRLDIDRDWLMVSESTDTQYCPQLGDKVFYIAQAHMQHLSEMPEGRMPPWQIFPTRWPIVECIVVDILYSFPSSAESKRSKSIVCTLTLELTGIPQKGSSGKFISNFISPRSTRNSNSSLQFPVTLRKLYAPDFIIPYHLFMRALKLNYFQIGITITSVFRECDIGGNEVYKLYDGTLVGTSDVDPSDWPHSPFECIEAKWTLGTYAENDYDRISPWDIVTFGDINLSQQYDQYYKSKLPDTLVLKVSQKIDELMDDSTYEAFHYPVDISVYYDYYSRIPVPMYLDLIKTRLSSNYYRQVEALKYDINLLFNNCLVYNVPDAQITQHARQLTSLLLKVVDEDAQLTDSSEGGGSDEKLVFKFSKKGIQFSASDSVESKVKANDESPDSSSMANKTTNTDNGEEKTVSTFVSSKEESLIYDEHDDNSSKNNDTFTLQSQSEVSTSSSSQQQRLKRKYHDRGENEDAPLEVPTIKISTKGTNRNSPSIVLSNIKNDVKSLKSSADISPEDNGRLSLRLKLATRSKENAGTRNRETAVYDDDKIASNGTRRSTRSIRKRDEVSSDSSSSSESENEEDEEDSEAGDDSDASSLDPDTTTRISSRLRSKSTSDSNGKQLRRKNMTTSVAKKDENQHSRGDIKRKLHELLKYAKKVDADKIFTYPVSDEDAPGYSEIILEPMDLSLISSKLENGEYQSQADLMSDIHKMYDNCELYNEPGSEIAKEANKQRVKLMEKCEEIFR